MLIRTPLFVGFLKIVEHVKVNKTMIIINNAAMILFSLFLNIDYNCPLNIIKLIISALSVSLSIVPVISISSVCLSVIDIDSANSDESPSEFSLSLTVSCESDREIYYLLKNCHILLLRYSFLPPLLRPHSFS